MARLVFPPGARMNSDKGRFIPKKIKIKKKVFKALPTTYQRQVAALVAAGDIEIERDETALITRV